MLKEILSPNSCKSCRMCCVFDRDDVWEIPVFSNEKRTALFEEMPEAAIKPVNGGGFVFEMEFDEEGLAYCPALSENGCTLKESKPFDCKIWPFRVMERGGELFLTLAPLCEAVNGLDEAVLGQFAQKLAPAVFDEAEKNPSIVKPYVDGYKIFAAKSRP